MCKIDGRKVAVLRRSQKMSQEDLAKKSGLSRSSIGNYETGKFNASDEALDMIAQALGVEPKELDKDFIQLGKAVIEGKNDSHHIHNTDKRYLTPQETQEILDKLRSYSDSVSLEEAKRALTKANQSTVGNKVYAVVAIKGLNIPVWQRNTDKEKCLEISQKYDENKYDPIKVYAFNEKLYVADGAHRLIAYIMRGEEYILVELMDIETEIEAAHTFLLQSLGRRRMSQNDMWRAAIKAGLVQYETLRKIAIKNKIQIKADLKTIKNPVGIINAVSGKMLRIAHSDPDVLEKVFALIKTLGWNASDTSPYKTYILCTLKNMYANFSERENELEKLMMENCMGVTYFEEKVATVNTQTRLYDVLMEDISKNAEKKTA